MEMTYYIPFSLFFIIVAIGMLLINKITKGKMKVIEKFIVVICIIASISTASLKVVSLMNNKTESLRNIYSGYVYLLEGSMEKADQYFNKELDQNENNELALYGKSQINVIKGNYNESRNILEKTLSITKDENLQKVMESDLKELENSQSKTRSEIEVKAVDSLNEVVESIKKKNKRKIDEIDKYVSIEQKLNSNEDTYKLERALEDMLAKDNNDIEAKKLLAKTYLQNNRFKEAYEEMIEVVSKEKDLSNITLLSDIVIECHYNNINLLDEEDKEIQKYNKKLKKIEEDIKKIDDNNTLNTIIKKNENNEKLEELYSTKEKIKKEKQSVIIKRTINYLSALFDKNDKDEILKKLQIAKLYYISGENEKSKDFINKAIDGINTLKDTNNYTTKALNEYSENLIENREKKNENRIKESAKKIINVVNAELSDPIKDSDINSAWEDFLVAYAKYSNIPVVITKIDVKKYPDITVYTNFGGEKQGWLYFNKNFNNSDFEIEDTNQKIKDFTVEKIDNNKTNICIAIDKSQSMSGMALREAKNASIEFIRNIGRTDRVGIIAFSDDIVTLSDLSKDEAKLEAKINSISEGGDTSVYDAGIEAINKIKDEDAKKVVILLTDGSDNSSYSDSEELIQIANSNETVVYTIGLGKVQDNVLSEIASRTGGQFYKAPSSVELSMIYEEIQKKINNIYKFNYSIAENTTKDHRYSKIILSKDKGFDIKDYVVDDIGQAGVDETFSSGPEDNIELTYEETADYEFIPGDKVENKLMFESINISNIIKASDGKEYSVIINGKGFNKSELNIKVGKYNIDKNKFEVVDGNKIKVFLPEDIEIGHYSIYGENQLGEKALLRKALAITKPNQEKQIILGDMIIKADSIIQTAIGYSAFGNIVINDFIYIDKPIEIDTNKQHNTQHNYFSGKISGNGKMYIKFNPYSDNFIVKNFKIHEQILDSNEFEIEAKNIGSYIYNKNMTDQRVMMPILQLQPKKIKVLKDEIEISALKFYLAGLDDESKKAVRNLSKFTKKVPLWVSTSEFKVSVNSEGYHFKSTEIWLEDTITAVPKLLYLKKLIIKADLPEGALSAKGTIMLGSIFGEGLSDKLGLKFKLEAKDMNLDTIEMQLKYTIPIKAPFLYLESVGGGVSELANADNWLDARLKLLASASSFKIKKIPIIGDIDVIKFSELELNTRFSSKQFGFKGKAKFLTTDIAELKVQFGATKKRDTDVEGFLLEGKAYADYELLNCEFNLDTLLYMTLNDNGYYSKANGDVYYKDYFWELDGGCISEISMTKKYVQYNLSVNNGKDDVDLLLRFEDGEDEPFWNIGNRIKFEINF